MKSDLIRYEGLYGEHDKPTLPDYIHFEPLEKRSKIYNWEIKEHLHSNLIQIFIIQSGNGNLISEKHSYSFTGPCLITVPANTLHGFKLEPNVIGEVITLSDDYLDKVFKNTESVFMVTSELKIISFKNSNEVFSAILNYVELITNEIKEEKVEKNLFISSLFQLLILNIYREINKNGETNIDGNNKSLSIFKAFQKSVKATINQHLSVQAYASELNISAVHLNRISKKVCNKSALAYIQDQLLKEAKKYLSSTDYTIAEVSYLLNFNEPAYFSRLFRNTFKMSPKEFRASLKIKT